MLVSVVIPTYRRCDNLLRALDSLSRQALDAHDFEVIAVDDGSDYDPAAVTEREWPFRLDYVRKPNGGATVARNVGADRASGDVLVFMDDDVTAGPQALAILTQACLQTEKVLAMGNLQARSPDGQTTHFQEMGGASSPQPDQIGADTTPFGPFIHFSWANTQLIAVRRAAFYDLGKLQDPSGGWPNWDDVDFGYRAHLAGFRLLLCTEATGIHWDYSLADLHVACRRWERASVSAVQLFETHPGLRPHIPMYHDKTPVDWRDDNPRLVARKLARGVIATPPVLWSMERSVALLERYAPRPGLLAPLYRLISASYMYRGYRTGLRQQRGQGKQREALA